MHGAKTKRIWSTMLAAVLATGSISGTSIEIYAAGTEQICTEAEITSETGKAFDTDIQLELQGLQRETEEEQTNEESKNKGAAAGEQAEESAAGEILGRDEIHDTLEKPEENGESDTAEVEEEESAAEEDGESDVAEIPETDRDPDMEEKTAETEELQDAAPETEIASLSVEAETVYSGSSTGNFANVVVFVDFADTDHQSHDNCLKNVEKTLDLFNFQALG